MPQLTPQVAFIGYCESSSDIHKRYHYWLVHRIDTTTGQPRLLAGVPLTETHIAEIKDTLSSPSNASLPLLPPDILACRLETTNGPTVWWTPAAIRPIFLAAPHKSGLAPYPPLVFAVKRTQLQVFALAENARPNADTPLFTAPFPNIDGDGQVCMGSCRMPANSLPESISEWTKRFFESEFSLHHDTKTLDLWKTLTASKADCFPTEQLTPTKRTVQNLLAELASA